MQNKETVVILHGHLYLFWTMGVYYTWELAERYKIILIVNEDYREDIRFQDLCVHLHIHYIYYFPKPKKYSLSTHLYLINNFKKILLKHKPTAILQYDYIGIENMYLFHLARRLIRCCKNIVLTTSAPSTQNTAKYLEYIKHYKAKELSKKYKVPEKVIRLTGNTLKGLCNVFDFQIVPMLFLGVSPYFPISFTNNIDNVPKKNLFDYFLGYCDEDIAYITQIFKNKDSFIQTRCPIYTIGKACNNQIYNVFEDEIVIIFPSLIGIKTFQEEIKVLDIWIEAIFKIKQKLLSYDFAIKFHPGLKNNCYLPEIKEYLTIRCPFLSILEETDNAIELILKSKIVVSDTSTTLWFTRFIPTKLAISLDMHNYVISGDMKFYSNIIYIQDIEQIDGVDFEEILELREKDYDSINSDLPSLNSSIKRLVNT